METKDKAIPYLENLSLVGLGILFFALPIIVSPVSTDQYSLPKYALIATVALLGLLLLSLKMIFELTIKIRKTPFDFPIVLFTIAIFLSSLFAVNKADSVTSFVLFLFSVIIYFITTNIAKDKKQALFLISSLVLGGAISSIITIFSFLKIYILPYSFTHSQTFTPLGSLLDQAIYLTLLLPVAIYLALPLNFSGVSSLKIPKLISFGIGAIIILFGLIITFYELFYIQNPTILPFKTGLQISFAAVSQNTTRILEGFLLGSGFGTYSVDFSRFKQASFNQDPTLWQFTFFRSSSFILELLATIGILGFSTFLFFVIKALKELLRSIKNPLTLPLLLVIALSFFLPFTFTIQALLFILLGLFAVFEGLKSAKQDRFFDFELRLVALRRGLLAIEAPGKRSKMQNILPFMFGIIVFIFVIFIGLYSLNYIQSDIAFQRSIVAASKNNGSLTYEEQTKAIRKFPYRDGFYRMYSQTNLALANSLASQLPKDKAPDKKTQDNITTLIQQSINSGRQATSLGPQTALNWQNLSAIYRALIGFGQNAENFAVVSQQQAILLNPTNPQQYLALGGIYYQLGQWDNAQNQFQIAVSLKPDFPNAYYNLGHAMEQKNDIEGALAQYEIVKKLVTNEKDAKQITEEIKALTSNQKQQEKQTKVVSKEESTSPSLEIDKSSSNLPTQSAKIKIPPPTNATRSAK